MLIERLVTASPGHCFCYKCGIAICKGWTCYSFTKRWGGCMMRLYQCPSCVDEFGIDGVRKQTESAISRSYRRGSLAMSYV